MGLSRNKTRTICRSAQYVCDRAVTLTVTVVNDSREFPYSHHFPHFMNDTPTLSFFEPLDLSLSSVTSHSQLYC